MREFQWDLADLEMVEEASTAVIVGSVDYWQNDIDVAHDLDSAIRRFDERTARLMAMNCRRLCCYSRKHLHTS